MIPAAIRRASGREMLPWGAWGCWLQAGQSAASWRTQPAPSSRPGGKQPQEEKWRCERAAAAPGAAEGRFPAPKLSILHNALRSRSGCGISGLGVTSSEMRTCGLQIPAAGALNPACVSHLQRVHEVCASYSTHKCLCTPRCQGTGFAPCPVPREVDAQGA